MVTLGLLGCSSKVDTGSAGEGPSEPLKPDTGSSVEVPREPLGEALSHDWTEYRHENREDDVGCSGVENSGAVIEQVYFAQTHRMTPEWPFFFLVADRPAMVEVWVTGSGAAPEVSVTAFIDDVEHDSLCMAGPGALAATIDGTTHTRDDRFMVTLPSDWLQPGLSVEVRAGSDTRAYTASELGLLHAPELNLMLVMMDVLNYNHSGIDLAEFEPPVDFLEGLGGAMPTSATRLGRHAVRMPVPTLAVGSTEVEDGSPPVVLSKRLCHEEELPSVDDCDASTPVGSWDVNAASLRLIDALQYANGHWGSHYYYGHTGGLFPGGWGGGKTFVSADYHWVTIHELGHAASLPHWGDVFVPEEQDDAWYEYPWGGVGFDGGGRGPTWSYIQQEDLFVSPICEIDGNDHFGLERSDAMQRNISCGEWWMDEEGPWDGFSDFSAYAMFRYMIGASEHIRDWVADPVHGEMEYNLPAQGGFPVVDVMSESPTYIREDPDLAIHNWETLDFLMPQEHNRPVFTIYGSYHPGYPEVNILYEPLYYNGDLPRLIDPTDPVTFEQLALGGEGPFSDYFWWSKDLTFKVIYVDGSELTALYPYGSIDREWTDGFGPWRWDMLYFGLNVPADVDIKRIEIYERPFLVRYSDWIDEGNIANPDFGITAANFMDSATLIMTLER